MQTVIAQIGAITLAALTVEKLLYIIIFGLTKKDDCWKQRIFFIVVGIVVLIFFYNHFSGLFDWKVTDIIPLESISITRDNGNTDIHISVEEIISKYEIFYDNVTDVTVKENINCNEPTLIVYTKEVLGKKKIKFEFAIPDKTTQNEVILN